MKLLPARWFTRERLRPSVLLALALVATAAGLALYFTVPPVRFSNVYRGTVRRGYFHNKIVVIGGAEPELFDEDHMGGAEGAQSDCDHDGSGGDEPSDALQPCGYRFPVGQTAAVGLVSDSGEH